MTGRRSGERDGPAAVLPEGVVPPPDIPAAVFVAALHTYLEPRRLDMRALAAELGMGRSSLYRKVRSRDHLLGAVLWYLTRRAVLRAVEAAHPLRGAARVIAVVDHFLHDVHSQPALRRLLQEEPEAALRILTSKAGGVQQPLIAAVERLLAAEETQASVDLHLDRRALAYIIVRIGESFLYADVIADNQPDVDLAVEMVAQLLGVRRTGLAVPSPRADRT
ncbi:MAG TPA: QsdR family transcriptional regulator [Candidatus Dormibacteraeota bacterium]|nr:QsdR family transcriptional regulator [Candidatus Dormibacteraeota bacterium]